jgi:hypothetical protein
MSAPTPSEAPGTDPIRELLQRHAEFVFDNPCCYFELAYRGSTGWTARITDKPAEGKRGTAEYAKSRKVLARGQGETPDEAAAEALGALAEAKRLSERA